MASIVSTVETVTFANTHLAPDVPAPVWSVFRAIHFVHGHYWSWFRQGEVYTNPDNFHRLLLGHGLEFIAGNNILLQVASHCVLMLHKVLIAIKACIEVCEAWQDLCDAFWNRYQNPVEQNWSTGNKFFSPSTYVWLRDGWSSVIQWIVNVAVAIFKLFIALGKMSMRWLDAKDSFGFKPEKIKEGIRELFVNLAESSEMMTDGLEFILMVLEDPEYRQMLDEILKELGSTYTAEELIAAVRATWEKAQAVNEVLQYGDGIVKEGFNEMVHGAAASLNLHNYLPDSLVPKSITATEPTRPTQKVDWLLPGKEVKSPKHSKEAEDVSNLAIKSLSFQASYVTAE